MNIIQILPESSLVEETKTAKDLSRYLNNHNHNVVVVSSEGGQGNSLEDNEFKQVDIQVNKISLFSIVSVVIKLIEIIKENNIQIVHAHSPFLACIAFFACFRTGCILVTSCHRHYPRNFLYKIIGFGKLVIVPSNAMAQDLVDFGIRYQDIRLIPYGVDLEKFQFTPPVERESNNFIVGMIADLMPVKGHIYFLKAMAKVYQRIPNLHILIIGETKGAEAVYKEQLRTLTRRFGIAHIVDFLGYNYSLGEVFSKMDALVVASTQKEPFSRVVIEAQASGVPVIATKIPGIIEIIQNDRNGILVPPGDSDAICDAVIELSKDTSKANRISQDARENIQREYTLDKMGDKIINVYNEAMAQSKILLIQYGALRDIILSIPAFRTLRTKFPLAKIYCLTNIIAAPILSRCPYIDGIILYNKKDRFWRIISFVKLISKLMMMRFDVVIDLCNTLDSHIIGFSSFAAYRYGFNNPRTFSFLLNRKIQPAQEKEYLPAQQAHLLWALDIKLEDSSLELWPDNEDRNYIKKLLDKEWLADKQLIVGINIGADAKWKTKPWIDSYIIKLCEELAKNDMRVVFTGTDDDLMHAKKISSALQNAKPIIFCGKTNIHQLVCLIARCNVYISPDALPLYIAASAGASMVGIFGPTDPKIHMPQAQRAISISKDLACRPCYRLKCRLKDCMKAIIAEDVMGAIGELVLK